MPLSDYELSIIGDTKFLITKFEVITKITAQLDTLNNKLNKNINKYSAVLPAEWLRSTGKISRGENYKHLPYLVLDAPRIFNRHHLMVYRSMFWWGHEFSFTLHLQGNYLHQYLPTLQSHLEAIQQADVYISINSSPWEYYFDTDNYVPANQLRPELIINNAKKYDFIKISKRLPLACFEQVPDYGLETFDIFMQWLNPAK